MSHLYWSILHLRIRVSPSTQTSLNPARVCSYHMLSMNVQKGHSGTLCSEPALGYEKPLSSRSSREYLPLTKHFPFSGSLKFVSGNERWRFSWQLFSQMTLYNNTSVSKHLKDMSNYTFHPLHILAHHPNGIHLPWFHWISSTSKLAKRGTSSGSQCLVTTFADPTSRAHLESNPTRSAIVHYHPLALEQWQ